MISTALLAACLEVLPLMESSDGRESPNVYGITEIFVRDLNEHAGYEKWDYADRLDRAKAMVMVTEYLLEHVSDTMTPWGIYAMYKLGPSGMLRPMSDRDHERCELFAKLVEERVAVQKVTKNAP